MRRATLMALTALVLLPGCGETLATTSPAGRPMRDAAQYVRTHRGQGTRRAMHAPYAEVYAAFVAQLEENGMLRISKEEGQIVGALSDTDYAIAVYFYRGAADDRTDAEVLIASPSFAPEECRRYEAATLRAVADELAKSGAGTAPDPGAPTAAPPAAGCAKDTDCKGDRLCVKGECVDPPARAPH